MLTIDRLSLQLPAGYGDRAPGIVDMIGARLAELDWPRNAALKHLRVEHALSSVNAPDAVVAGAIASAIAREIRAVS
jgi:hypothetical protein